MKEEQLTGYILGLLPEKECREVEAWYALTEENAKQLEQLYFILRVKQAEDVKAAVDPDSAFLKFKKEIRKREKNKKLQRSLRIFQRVAAILFLPLLFLTSYGLLKHGNQSGQDIRVTANAGMISQFSLPDGSKVWLNSGSSLVYPSVFNRSQRTVRLTGQGYFDITRNTKSPFIVEAPDGYAVQVYGTEFNIVAYEDENTIETTLVTGAVELQIGAVNQPLKPEQKAVFNKETKQLQIEYVNPVLETSWKDGRIIFRNHPMGEVLKTLGRYYNVRFVVENEDVMNSFIRGTFEYEQLPQVMEYLHLASGIKYRIQKPVIKDDEIVEKSVVYISK